MTMKRNFIIVVLLAAFMSSVIQTVLAADTTKTSLTETATGERIKWQVISSGGTKGTSTNFQLSGTVGQTAVGHGSSTNFGLSHGFWQQYGPTTCCNHDGLRGDVNMSGSINVSDVTYLVAYLKQSPPGSPAPPCFEEGDVNGSGTINVGDVTYLVAYLKQSPPGSPPPPPCP
jgi:hypothetical protein